MLATNGASTPPAQTATAASHSPAPATTSCSSSMSPASVIGCHISNNNNVQNIKCEPHLTPSPTGGVMSADNTRLLDEVGNKINGASETPLAAHQRENSAMQRKNSNSSIISSNSAGAFVHTSPTSLNNNNDNSNSSNSTISTIMDSDAISGSGGQLHIQQQPNESNANCSTKAGTKANSIEDSNENVNINPSASGNFLNACAPKENSSSSTSSSSSSSFSSSSVKDDPEIHAVLGNLANVKKEQNKVETPEMSPDGFGSLPALSGNNSSTAQGGAVSTGGNHNNTGKSSNSLGTSSGGISLPPNGGGCISSILNDVASNGQHQINNFSGSVPIMPNSMDYMQQQNHIFVFSTQLANKGAESVLSGQFPTIIAYHCTQPATKKFLEDFFLKNPMKMAKIQRQNSLNMAISVSTGHQWVGGSGGGNSISSKNQQKSSGRNNVGGVGPSSNQICNNSNMDNKSSSSALNASSNAGFPDASDSLSGDADLMNWEQSNINLENITNNSNTGHSINIGEGSDNISGSPHNASSVGTASLTQQSPNKASAIGASAAPVSPGDGMQPSLQGVKVPDENLTPQQRQHREEQLAKLKKMNQFLFPEHGGDMMPEGAALQGPNQLGKLGGDGIIGNTTSSGSLVGILGDSASNAPVLSNGNTQLPHSRGSNSISGMGRSGSIGRNAVNLGPGPPEEGGMPVGIIGVPGEMNNIHCGTQNSGPNLILNAQPGMPCSLGNISGPLGSNNIGGQSRGQGVIMPHGGMNSINNCAASAGTGGLMHQGGLPKGIGGGNPMDQMGGGGPTQMEWAKMQYPFYDERTKGNKGGSDIMAGITGLCRSISAIGGSYARSGQPGSVGVPVSASGPSGRSQGPPPPYHPTQRSASVPIAIQSPNPSSPNNPTSNLSLPSPRTASGSCGTTLNSPSSDGQASTSTVTTSTTSAMTTASISTTTNSSNQCKAFQQEDSPTGTNGNNLSGANNLRNSLNHFNSNPSTPLSNMSPKDLENMGSSTGIAGDAKNLRPSPKGSRTPLVSGNNNNSEATSIEGRFPLASPGANFSSNLQNSVGNCPKMLSGSADNQTSGPNSFGRRPDHLPLNPNSSRPPPIKQNHNFDPISSLAQMSQQLTSCVSSNGVVSGPSSVGVSGEMPIGGGSGHQHMEALMGPVGAIDSGLEHCGNVPGNSAAIGLPHHMMGGAAGQYGAGNCHMGGSILSPMGSRLLAPKMGGGFVAGPGGIMRDGPPGFHGGMPPHRMMGRMGVNFCPFNGSPNIQVKASTPNTIQYMPVRPQTNNSNPRVPPSLEFLQRFANPQLSNCAGDGPMMGSSPVGSTDPNKMSNASPNAQMQNTGLNFFQNCNQLGSGSSPGIINGGNQVDIGPGMMSGHSDMGGVMNMSGNSAVGMNIRGMRPGRQGSMGPGSSLMSGGMHRMQGPGNAHLLGGVGGMNPFGNNTHEAMECVNSDPNGLFSNQTGGQGHCQNMSASNVVMNGPLGSNEQNSPMQGQINGPGMIGSNAGNGPVVSGSGPVSGSAAGSSNEGPGGGYKSYMGQSTNDLKYAQQYHNFQQQLYATSTRSQVSQQMGGSPAMGLPGSGINSGLPTNSNAGFFVSK